LKSSITTATAINKEEKCQPITKKKGDPPKRNSHTIIMDHSTQRGEIVNINLC